MKIASLALIALTLSAVAASTPAAVPSRVSTVLVTGANRGIGFELARLYAEKGWKVIATVREPARAPELRAVEAAYPNLTIETLDVASDLSIRTLAQKYRGQPIDVLLNNAGYLGTPERQSIAKELDYAMFEQIFRVNAYAPLMISQAFLDNVLAGEQKKIVAMTSGIGSMASATRFGGLTFYRMSKTALNMGMRSMQAELRTKGVKVGLFAPGEVETRMLRDSGFSGRGRSPADAAADIVRNIEALSDQEAKVVDHTGEPIPY